MSNSISSRPPPSLLNLPDDVLIGSPTTRGVLGHLAPADLARCGEVSKAFERLSRSAELWRRFSAEPRNPPSATPAPAASSSAPSPNAGPSPAARTGYARWLANESARVGQEIDSLRAEANIILNTAYDFGPSTSLCFERIGVLRMRRYAVIERELPKLEAQKKRLDASLAAVDAHASR